MTDMKWKPSEVSPEDVRLALQKVQLSESRSTDDGSKIVPQVLISAARYAIESLMASLQSLKDEIQKLERQIMERLTLTNAPLSPGSESLREQHPIAAPSCTPRPKAARRRVMPSKSIFCCECVKEVPARLTDGKEIYPHRSDLFDLPFWKCDACNNFVGCHHKTKDRTRPLGVIVSQPIKNMRKKIHALLDPVWQSGKRHRGSVYAEMSKRLGYQFHTAEIRTIREANVIYGHAQEIAATPNP